MDKKWLLMILGILIIFSLSFASADLIEYQNLNSTDQGMALDYNVSQTFTIGTLSGNITYYLDTVSLMIRRANDNGRLFHVGLYETNGTDPLNNNLLAMNTTNVTDLAGTELHWVNFTFNNIVTLQPNTTYAIVTWHGSTNQNIIRWGLNASATSYNGGTMFTQAPAENSGEWLIIADKDMAFQTFALWTLNITEVTSNFTANEGTSKEFVLNITQNGDLFSNAEANLVFNQSSYVMAKTKTGNTYYFRRNLTMPLPNSQQNYTFYYQINQYRNTNVTSNYTENYTAHISPLYADNCSLHGDLLYNFTLYDEETKSTVNNNTDNPVIEIDLTFTNQNDQVLISFNETYYNVSNTLICTSANMTDTYANLIVRFWSDNRVVEFYHIDKHLIALSDYQTKIGLYDLLLADSTSFLFNFYDENGLQQPDSIIHVYRKYIGEGAFTEVERAKQDQNGEAVVHLVEEDVVYYFSISLNDTTLFVSSEYTAKCISTPCSITIDATTDYNAFPTDYDLIGDGGYTLSLDEANRQVTMDYLTTGSHQVNLTLYKYNADGTYEMIDQDAVIGTSGTLTVTAPLTAGNQTFFASVHVDDQFISSFWVDLNEKAGNYFGNTISLFLVGLIVLTLGLMAISRGALVIVAVLLGVGFAGALGLVDYRISSSVALGTYLMIAGGLILWKLTRNR